VPTLGWVRTACLAALLKDQSLLEAFIFEQFEFAWAESGTADPSASLGMTKGTVVLPFGLVAKATIQTGC
jgi:hypothetical protein